MISRCSVAGFALLAVLCSTAFAAAEQPYTQAAFAAAQAQNKRILVNVEAPWCSTCAIQRPIISRLDKQPALNDLVVFTVDFDRDTEALRALRVSVQSTLILFHGKTEIARMTGETDPHAIDAFLEQAPSRYAQAGALSLASYVLAMLAGALSILSPCVLPLLPIIIAGAATSHRLGPPVLAAGLAVSFVTIGLFVATVGFSIGIESSTFRLAAAVLMVVFGLVLLSQSLESRFGLLTAPLQTLGGRLMTHRAPSGLGSQFLIGLLFGAVWSPCTGALLGAAATLAMQRQGLGQAALIMLLFGIGAAAPLAIIGALSRETLLRWRARISSVSHTGQLVLGAILLLLGILMLTGLDRSIETALLGVTPDWLTRLTTSI